VAVFLRVARASIRRRQKSSEPMQRILLPLVRLAELVELLHVLIELAVEHLLGYSEYR